MWVKSMKTLPCAFRPELMGKESARLCFPFRLCPCAKGLEDLVARMGFHRLDLDCVILFTFSRSTRDLPWNV